MVPVDVVEHLLPGVDQRVQRADALLPDRDAQRHIAARTLDPGDGQRIDQPRRVDAAVRHVAGPGVARQVVELVHIERAGEHPAQQPVGRRQIRAVGIDEVGDALRIDAPRFFQDRGDLDPSIRRRPPRSCGTIGGPSSSMAWENG